MGKELKNILLEIQYFPCLQYLSKWLVFENVIIEQWENYTKGSYRNRCHIASANGIQRLSVPLQKGKNEQQNIKDVQISYGENWQTKHWIAIKSAYGNAPFFEFYADDIHQLLNKKQTFLFDLNIDIIQTLIELIGIEQSFSFSNAFEKEVTDKTLDFRNAISPKLKSQKKDIFFNSAEYQQQVFSKKSDFSPNLSTLDLLFCKGPESILLLEECINNDFLHFETS